MPLSTAFKKMLVDTITNRVFLNFSQEIYINQLRDLIRDINRYEKGGIAYLGIQWKGEFYIGFKQFSNIPFKSFNMRSSHPYFADFMQLINKKTDYDKSVNELRNYLHVGLSMCNELQDIQFIFPESILNLINTITVLVPLSPLQPKLKKHIAFVEKNKDLVEEIEKQLVINIIAPEHPDAEIPF